MDQEQRFLESFFEVKQAEKAQAKTAAAAAAAQQRQQQQAASSGVAVSGGAGATSAAVAAAAGSNALLRTQDDRDVEMAVIRVLTTTPLLRLDGISRDLGGTVPQAQVIRALRRCAEFDRSGNGYRLKPM